MDKICLRSRGLILLWFEPLIQLKDPLVHVQTNIFTSIVSRRAWFCDDIFVDYVTQTLVVILVRKLLATRNHPKFDFKYLTYMYFRNLWIPITYIT